MSKWQNDKLTNWQNDKMTKCQKVYFWKYYVKKQLQFTPHKKLKQSFIKRVKLDSLGNGTYDLKSDLSSTTKCDWIRGNDYY
jgi:hypothetical protein